MCTFLQLLDDWTQARAGVAGAPSARDPEGLALLGDRACPTYLHPRLPSTRALDRFRNQARLLRCHSCAYETNVSLCV